LYNKGNQKSKKEGIFVLIYDGKTEGKLIATIRTDELLLQYAQAEPKASEWYYSPAIDKAKELLVYRDFEGLNHTYKGPRQQAILLSALKPSDLQQEDYVFGAIWRVFCRDEWVRCIEVHKKGEEDKHLHKIGEGGVIGYDKREEATDSKLTR
jgi:hypothetical protein